MSTFVVNNLNDSGAGSLRAAIDGANADTSGSSTISFTVNGTIVLDSDLPSLTHTVTIDATSAPTHVSGGPPVVEIDCNGHGGLVFASGSDNSQLMGLSICHASGSGVQLDAGGITLGGNYVGLDLTGAAAGNAGNGVTVSASSSGNLIGFNPDALSNVVSNVISGNGGNGIALMGSSSNTLVDNYVGTDPTGAFAIPNGGNGIWLTAASNGNEIGGTAFTDSDTGEQNDPTGDKGTTTPVFVVPPLGNLVSGNAQNGILIDSNSRNNVLNGNFVGTAAGGDSALGNTLDGIAINGSDDNSLIGCLFSQNPFVYYNVVSGNGGNGLHITNSDRTTVQANFFGVGANNTDIVANTLDGILVDGTSANTMVGGPIPLGNVSAGNGANGIEVRDTASFFTSFNTFGGMLAFKGAAPNGNDGILITSTGGDQTLQTNVLSGNLNDGIQISGDASGVTVFPAIVGLDTNGQLEVPNHNNGLEIDDTAHDNIIGGHALSLLSHNIFSANFGYGIAILDHAYDNWVFNSYVGTDAGATEAFGNQLGGILIDGSATNNKIGDVASVPTQPVAVLISGNTGNGITLGNDTSFTQILNNIIGFDANGNPDLPNSGEPIVVNDSTDNVIFGNQIACFAAGTGIATPEGRVLVQHLKEGDQVLTLEGKAATVRWVGHRRVDCRRHRAPKKVQPIRIAAHAFDRNQPARDLLVSPDHAIFAADVLIPVRYLTNGITIAQVDVASVRYFHVELDRHEVILAEGLPVESYLDTGDRAGFDNAGGTVALHPEWGWRDVTLVFEAQACAPLCIAGPEVDEVRKRLATRTRPCLPRQALAK